MVSKTYAPQFVVERGKPINSRSLCHTIGKSHKIFIAQCIKLGFKLEHSPMTIMRKSGATFQNDNYIVTERQVLIYMMAHEPIYRVKISRLLEVKELRDISLFEVL